MFITNQLIEIRSNFNHMRFTLQCINISEVLKMFETVSSKLFCWKILTDIIKDESGINQFRMFKRNDTDKNRQVAQCFPDQSSEWTYSELFVQASKLKTGVNNKRYIFMKKKTDIFSPKTISKSTGQQECILQL